MRTAIESLVVSAVAVLSLRRLVLLVAALRPARPLPPPGRDPSVTVLVPARNEQVVAGRLLASLSRLEYPRDRLAFVLVTDGCTDATPSIFAAWAAQRPNARVIVLPMAQGKASALNAGLEAVNSDIVVVVDADLEPEREFLREIVRPFPDDKVGAAAAFLRPANAERNIVSRYAAVTTWVHQLVTSRGTDRLGLNPPTLGAAAYRRAALEQIGGFPVVPAGVDVATSAALTRCGWQSRFVHTAVAGNTVVSSADDFWRQHVRWARAALGVRPREAGPRPVPVLQRLELAASSLGYADRVVFAAALAGAAAGALSWTPALLYLAVPALEIIAAVVKAGARRELGRYMFAAAGFFVADLIASVVAVVAHASDRPHRWHNPRQFAGPVAGQ